MRLSHLTGLDFYVSYWSEGLVAHTFVSFVFDNAPPLCISIETRPEVSEGFNPIAATNPEAQPYKFTDVDDQVVLVDPTKMRAIAVFGPKVRD